MATSSYEMLRELMRKVEAGEAEILNMSIAQEYPEMQMFQSIDGRRIPMARTSPGVVNIDLKVGLLAAAATSEPGYIEKPRKRRAIKEAPPQPINNPLRYGARKLDID